MAVTFAHGVSAMRNVCLLAATAALTGCATAPDPAAVARAEAEFQQLIAGKVAGAPISCLSRTRSADMIVIDDSRIAFRNGSSVYVNDFRGGQCGRLGSGHYTLVTRSFGGGLCSGDIAEVMDLQTGTSVGSCALGEFIPYTGPRT